ncbi:hypothetical protein BHE74_00034201 [Ensete ventricosum]|nr:hypothetical protein BHE74_00034201 [Ensete ventricosum]
MEDSSLSPRPSHFLLGSSTLDELYRPLPWLYLAFMVIWAFSAFSWIVNTWRNRFVQVRRIIFFLEELSIAQSEFSIFKRNSVPFLELEIEVQAKMQKFSNRTKCYRREKELRLEIVYPCIPDPNREDEGDQVFYSLAIYMNVDEALDTYWFRLLVREWAQVCIFLYIG